MAPFTVIKRRAAWEAGLTKFYTGRSCSHGHDAQRWVVSGACILCARKAQNEYAASMRGNRNSIVVRVRVHPDDAEAIRHTATMLNALRDAKIAAAVERTGEVKSPFAAKLALLPEGTESPHFEPRTAPPKR